MEYGLFSEIVLKHFGDGVRQSVAALLQTKLYFLGNFWVDRCQF